MGPDLQDGYASTSADSEERLRVLADASRSFAAPHATLQRLLTAIVRTVVDRIGDGCTVTLVEGDYLINAANAHRDAALEADFAASVEAVRPRLTTDKTNVAEVVRSGRPRLVSVVEPSVVVAEAEDRIRPLLARLSIHSFLTVPIYAQGSVIGTLTIFRSVPDRSYVQEDVVLLQDLADRAGLAIDNARSLANARRMADHFRIVSESGEIFSAATSDPRALLDTIARRLCEVIGESCAIRLLADDGQTIELSAAHHVKPELAELTRQAILAAPQRLDEGVTGPVVSSGQSVLIPRVDMAELAASVLAERRPLIQRADVGTLMAVPLIHDHKTIGAISMSRGSAAPAYTPDDLRLAEQLARFAALTIANSRLLASTRQALAERARAEAELRGTELQLREAQKMEAIGRLAGGVAHDFNNNLMVILSYASLGAHMLPHTDPVAEYLEQITRAGERAAALTRQLLAFSRRQVVAPRSLELGSVIDGMTTMLRRIAGEDIELHIDHAPNVRNVLIDPGQLEQVVMNLTVNARDAMPGGGTVTIATRDIELDAAHCRNHPDAAEGPHVVLSVRDSGVGMSKTVQERIFEPFFTTKEQGKGTGLGLSIVYGIVKQSGGSIVVESEPEHGTTFSVYLPATQATSAPSESQEPRPFTDVGGSETILLVDDEDQLRSVARVVLERAGYRVLTACNGREALQLYEQHEPIDLLLTDVVMPQMNGPNLASHLRSARPDLRVLFMSGYSDDAVDRRGVLDPDIELLQKPITPESLLAKVRQLLDRK